MARTARLREAESEHYPRFYSPVSAADLARDQGVKPIRRRGQIKSFSDPDPREAEWFACQVRQWRGNSRASNQR